MTIVGDMGKASHIYYFPLRWSFIVGDRTRSQAAGADIQLREDSKLGRNSGGEGSK